MADPSTQIYSDVMTDVRDILYEAGRSEGQRIISKIYEPLSSLFTDVNGGYPIDQMPISRFETVVAIRVPDVIDIKRDPALVALIQALPDPARPPALDAEIAFMQGLQTQIERIKTAASRTQGKLEILLADYQAKQINRRQFDAAIAPWLDRMIISRFGVESWVIEYQKPLGPEFFVGRSALLKAVEGLQTRVEKHMAEQLQATGRVASRTERVAAKMLRHVSEQVWEAATDACMALEINADAMSMALLRHRRYLAEDRVSPTTADQRELLVTEIELFQEEIGRFRGLRFLEATHPGLLALVRGPLDGRFRWEAREVGQLLDADVATAKSETVAEVTNVEAKRIQEDWAEFVTPEQQMRAWARGTDSIFTACGGPLESLVYQLREAVKDFDASAAAGSWLSRGKIRKEFDRRVTEILHGDKAALVREAGEVGPDHPSFGVRTKRDPIKTFNATAMDALNERLLLLFRPFRDERLAKAEAAFYDQVIAARSAALADLKTGPDAEKLLGVLSAQPDDELSVDTLTPAQIDNALFSAAGLEVGLTR